MELAAGEVRRLTARKAVVLATGTGASCRPSPAWPRPDPWDNRSVTAAKEIPRRLLVLGGGAVGAEMAQAFRRLGAEEVTVVEAASACSPGRSPSPATRSAPPSKPRASPSSPAPGWSPVPQRRGDRHSRRRPHHHRATRSSSPSAAARPPATSAWRPSAWSPASTSRSTTSCERLVTWLYAVGDCNGRALLTHMGKYQARLAGDVILGKDVAATAPIPRVTFTDPQVCAVGLTEAQARDARHRRARRHLPHRRRLRRAHAGRRHHRHQPARGRREPAGDRRRHLHRPGRAELLHSATIAIVGEVTIDTLWHAVPRSPPSAKSGSSTPGGRTDL